MKWEVLSYADIASPVFNSIVQCTVSHTVPWNLHYEYIVLLLQK